VENCGKVFSVVGERPAGGHARQALSWSDSGDSRETLGACSACSGDYEDPDRTAWTPDPEEVEELTEPTREEKPQESAAAPVERDDEFLAKEE
jgi:hypothetical protein